MLHYGFKSLFCIFVLLNYFEYSFPAKLKDALRISKESERQKRDLDGNDLPPMPLNNVPQNDPAIEFRNGGRISNGNTDYNYNRYEDITTTVPTTTEVPQGQQTVNIGSDTEFQFSSRLENTDDSPANLQPRTSFTGSSVPTRTGSGYRYTSQVYTGPGSQPDYRYRPPYDQLGYQTTSTSRQDPNVNQQGSRTQYNTGSGQTQYSPYVGTGVHHNYGGSGVQYVGGDTRYPLYNRNERVYGGSSNYIPNRGVLSNDPTCPTDRRTVLINGLGCSQAINTLGTFICYNYERVSQECCERCLSLKSAAKVGCEYGDWSYQCRNIQPFDCYNQRNREICCDTCRLHRQRQSVVIPGCEYGDLTPRCQIIREKRHLCYLPENKRLCCVTCPSLADPGTNVCQWGDQNPELCTPFDQQNQLRINCYMPTVKQICCQTCEGLKSRIREQIAGCEYGDRPVSFRTPYGVLDCASYIRQFGVEVCSNIDVSTHCCYTCYRYRSLTRDGKK